MPSRQLRLPESGGAIGGDLTPGNVLTYQGENNAPSWQPVGPNAAQGQLARIWVPAAYSGVPPALAPRYSQSTPIPAGGIGGVDVSTSLSQRNVSSWFEASESIDGLTLLTYVGPAPLVFVHVSWAVSAQLQVEPEVPIAGTVGVRKGGETVPKLLEQFTLDTQFERQFWRGSYSDGAIPGQEFGLMFRLNATSGPIAADDLAYLEIALEVFVTRVP